MRNQISYRFFLSAILAIPALFYSCNSTEQPPLEDSEASNNNLELQSIKSDSFPDSLSAERYKQIRTSQKYQEVGGCHDDFSSGILLGDEILIYDFDGQKIRDISKYSGSIVSILEIADTLSYDSEDFCSGFWNVYIKHPDFEGIVKGGNVYKYKYAHDFDISDNRMKEYYRDFLEERGEDEL